MSARRSSAIKPLSCEATTLPPFRPSNLLNLFDRKDGLAA
jgi:hypothetical protein